jgi:CheY-like chemotaxis protein/class 3 adenylate cyclase
MALIVVMEDDDTLRLLISSILKKAGHEVFQASDGLLGLELVRKHLPDVVVSDVQMPGMDGVTMITTMRAELGIARTPVILLTSLNERQHMRTGMISGADDYLTKPFLPLELCQAVDAQLMHLAVQNSVLDSVVNTAVKTALDSQRDSLSKIYESRLKSELSGDRWPSENDSQADERYDNATVLFVQLTGQALPHLLTPTELTDVLRRAYTNASDVVHLFGARHVHLVGEGLLAVFVQDTDTESVTHSMRAAKSAFGLVKSVQQSRMYLETKHPNKQIPDFKTSVALHSGPVTVAKIHDPMHGSTTLVLPVGETVSLAILLQTQSAALGWPVACTESALSTIANFMLIGRQQNLQLNTNSPAQSVLELLAFKPVVEDEYGDLA